MLIFDTEPFLIRSTLTGKMLERKSIGAYVKEDENGVILDPSVFEFKCGWGKTLKEAANHFIERNPNVLRCQVKFL